MSKRCELQKEYYQANGNYKGNGKYCDKYVSWLEEQILSLRYKQGYNDATTEYPVKEIAKKLDR